MKTRTSYAVTILAAGKSQRMGRNKMLLPWGSTTVLGWLIERWKQLQVRQIVIVCSGGERGIQEELDRLQFPQQDRVFNPAPDRGMFSSIQWAAAWEGWQAGLTQWIITLGDQPHLRQDTLQSLMRFAAVNPDKICQPTRQGRRKHPVVFPRTLFESLKDSCTQDLKQFLAQHPMDLAGFESGDAGLDLDMDTPEDYEAARKLVNCPGWQ